MEEQSNIHHVDLFVGERLKYLRKKHKLSQTAMGDMVGVSFQQIQKYENGFNRIPASKLFEFAEVLNVPVTYFYEGIEIDGADLDISPSDGRIIFKRSSPLKILLVEHGAKDAVRTRKAIETCKQKTEVYVENDGIKAIQFLKNKKGTNVFVRPDIIITALKLPKHDGINLLKDIKRDKDLKDIPVIILTNSIDVSDMLRAYKGQASGFIGKAADEEQFQHKIESAITYWADAVALPVV